MKGFIIGLILSGGATLGAVVAYGYTQAFTVPAAREEERQLIRAETLRKAIDLVQQRSRNNASVQKLSDSAICAELGGVWVNGACD